MVRASHELEEVVGAPLGRSGLGDDLLGEDVERSHGWLDRIEAPGSHAGEQGGALDQLVAGQREQPPGRCAGASVVGAADPLEEGGDRARRADLAHQLDRSDVDAELQRGRGDQRLELTGAQPGLDAVAAVLAETAVVRRDDVVAETFAELVREAFGHLACVDEHERCPASLDELGDAVQHAVHLGGGDDRLELARRAARGPTSRWRRWPLSTMAAAGSPIASTLLPTSRPATVSIGFCVAESPTRTGVGAHTCSSRSSVSARCAPRLSLASAWISSTITVSTLASVAAAARRGDQ